MGNSLVSQNYSCVLNANPVLNPPKCTMTLIIRIKGSNLDLDLERYQKPSTYSSLDSVNLPSSRALSSEISGSCKGLSNCMNRSTCFKELKLKGRLFIWLWMIRKREKQTYQLFEPTGKRKGRESWELNGWTVKKVLPLLWQIGINLHQRLRVELNYPTA